MLELFKYMALISTSLFGIKLILVMIGAHHGGMDSHGGTIDLHAGHGVHSAHIHHALHNSNSNNYYFKLWSFQNALAFFMGMGWVGQAALVEWNWSLGATLLVSSAFGFAMAVLSGILMALMSKLNSEPDEYNLESCVGKSAKVYLPIPAKGSGSGQVEVELGGGLKIVSAISDRDEIKQFQNVRVTSAENNSLVVSPVN